MSVVHAFTVAAPNYLPRVRALFRSVRRHHPNWRLHLVVADQASVRPDEAGADELHALDSLGIPEWRSWAFGHSLVELATGLKPFALARLLERPDAGAVVYLDPDIVLYSPIEEAVEGLQGADILLTPHQVRPVEGRGAVLADEVCTLQHGVFNLGFLAVRPGEEGERFARWWADRLYHFCRESIPNGLYTDQRWMDLAPAFFEGVRILRDERLNVSIWNLATRRIDRSPDGGWRVNGRPLGFYHFSAFDSGAHHLAAAGQDPAFLALLEGYRRDIGPAAGRVAWGLGAFEDGEPIDPPQRYVYRLRADLQRTYPDPYASGPVSYQAWWRVCGPIEFPRLFDAATNRTETRRLADLLTGA